MGKDIGEEDILDINVVGADPKSGNAAELAANAATVTKPAKPDRLHIIIGRTVYSFLHGSCEYLGAAEGTVSGISLAGSHWRVRPLFGQQKPIIVARKFLRHATERKGLDELVALLQKPTEMLDAPIISAAAHMNAPEIIASGDITAIAEFVRTLYAAGIRPSTESGHQSDINRHFAKALELIAGEITAGVMSVRRNVKNPVAAPDRHFQYARHLIGHILAGAATNITFADFYKIKTLPRVHWASPPARPAPAEAATEVVAGVNGTPGPQHPSETPKSAGWQYAQGAYAHGPAQRPDGCEY